MKEASVVTAFLTRGGKIFIVRRSGRVGTYQGRWSAISGYLEETPLGQARREIREETGLGEEAARLLKEGEPLVIEDAAGGRRWLVHPFLFEVAGEAGIALDWENEEGRWIDPAELGDYETVPSLAEALGRVWPP